MSAYDLLENSLRLINTQQGREKTCRLLHYFIKFIIPILTTQGVRFQELIEKLQKLKNSMSITRKVLRFGMPLTYAHDIISRFKTHERKGVKMIFWRTLQDISKSLYYILDHPIYANKLGLIQLNKSRSEDLRYHSNRFWLISSIIDIMCDVVDLYQIQKDIQIADVRERLRRLYQLHFLKMLSILRSVMDIPTALHYMGSDRVNGQVAGLTGTVSSIISIYNLWGKPL
eukprot:403371800